MKTVKFLSIVAIATALLSACGQQNKNENNSTLVTQQTNAPQKGDHVESNLVCMVNDAYMGKEQLKVPYNNKIYYGCCEMCQERIPKDEKVRYAIDPQTLKKVDKATAYIVLIGDKGEVAYFENENSYTKFITQNKN